MQHASEATFATGDPLARLVRDLGEHVGLPQLTVSGSGACAIRFDDLITVNLKRSDVDASQLWLFSDLGTPAAGEAMHAALLRGNLFQDTVLSLTDDEPARVVISRALTWRSLNAPQLADQMAAFIDAAENWLNVLARP